MNTYTRLSKKLVVGTALCGALFMAASQGAKAQAFTAEQKAEMGTIIQEYLKENPDVVVEALDQYRTNQLEKQKTEARKNITDNMDYFMSDEVPVAGNPDGDILIVEFFDYNCGYCKRAYEDVMTLVENNDNARVVFMEMPILGPTSLDAAKWAMAAKNQGKYFEFHQALMETKQQKTEAILTQIANDLDLDLDQLKKDAGSEAVMAEISKSTGIARSIGITGTPAFIIGDQLYPGYLGEDGLSAAIDEVQSQD